MKFAVGNIENWTFATEMPYSRTTLIMDVLCSSIQINERKGYEPEILWFQRDSPDIVQLRRSLLSQEER